MLTELNLAGAAWVAAWAERLQTGALLLIDYGYPHRVLLPSRSNRHPCWLCWLRQATPRRPLALAGLNDITAFVDFAAVAEAGFDAGLDVQGYKPRRRHYLLNCGVLDCLARRGPQESAGCIRAARGAAPDRAAGDGGAVQGAGAVARPGALGFARGDRLHAL